MPAGRVLGAGSGRLVGVAGKEPSGHGDRDTILGITKKLR